MSWLTKETEKRQVRDKVKIEQSKQEWKRASDAYDEAQKQMNMAHEAMRREHNCIMGLKLFGLPQRALAWLQMAEKEDRFFITYGPDTQFRVDLNKRVLFVAGYDEATDHAWAEYQYVFLREHLFTYHLDSHNPNDLFIEPEDVMRALKRFLSNENVTQAGKLAEQTCTDLATDLEQSHHWHTLNLFLNCDCLSVTLVSRALWQFVKLWKNRPALVAWIESFNPLVMQP